jgi:hypothetical protein
LKSRYFKSELIAKRQIQNEILKDPAAGDIIEGTGGLRKLRVAGKGKGKSGGYRVIYLDLPSKERTMLIDMYGKGEQEDITAEDKVIMKKLVSVLKGES